MGRSSSIDGVAPHAPSTSSMSGGPRHALPDSSSRAAQRHSRTSHQQKVLCFWKAAIQKSLLAMRRRRVRVCAPSQSPSSGLASRSTRSRSLPRGGSCSSDTPPLVVSAGVCRECVVPAATHAKASPPPPPAPNAAARPRSAHRPHRPERSAHRTASTTGTRTCQRQRPCSPSHWYRRC